MRIPVADILWLGSSRVLMKGDMKAVTTEQQDFHYVLMQAQKDSDNRSVLHEKKCSGIASLSKKKVEISLI